MKNISLLLFCITPLISLAQKHDYIWLIDHGQTSIDDTQLNFNDNPMTIEVVHINMDMDRSSTTYSDKNGQLSLYTNGIWIADHNGNMVENGDTLNPGPEAFFDIEHNISYSIAQGTFFLPDPGNDSLVYLFHVARKKVNSAPTFGTFYYTIIDMRLNGGLGKVIQKNVPLLQGDALSNYNQPVTVRHANGRDWWIIVPDHMQPNYYRFLLTPNGVEGPWAQTIGFKTPTDYFWDYSYGQRTFSRDGTRFADYDFFHYVQLFDFDRCTGLFSNAQKIDYQMDSIYNNTISAVAFSPSGRYLYMTRTKIGYEIVQYDLQASNVAESEVVLSYCPHPVGPYDCAYANMILAPNDKIYLSTADTNAWHVIHNPDQPGFACDFVEDGFLFPLNAPLAWLPYFPYYHLYDTPDSPCDTLGINGPPVSTIAAADKNEVKLAPNPASAYLQLYLDHPAPFGTTLRLHDLAGRTLLSEKLPPGTVQHEVSVAEVPVGMYFYTLSFNNEKRWTGKIVVQR